MVVDTHSWWCPTYQVTELSEQLLKKEEEIRVMEEKYRRYLEKAKNVSIS